MEIYQRIDALIEDGNIQVQELSEKMGITRQQISRWRKGTSEPGAYKIKQLCQIYNVSADYILGLPPSLSWPRIEKERR